MKIAALFLLPPIVVIKVVPTMMPCCNYLSKMVLKNGTKIPCFDVKLINYISDAMPWALKAAWFGERLDDW